MGRTFGAPLSPPQQSSVADSFLRLPFFGIFSDSAVGILASSVFTAAYSSVSARFVSSSTGNSSVSARLLVLRSQAPASLHRRDATITNREVSFSSTGCSPFGPSTPSSFKRLPLNSSCSVNIRSMTGTSTVWLELFTVRESKC
jgi:hypothetical protein